MITPMVSVVTDGSETTSSPSPPMAVPISASHGTVFGAGACSASRDSRSLGSGIFSASCCSFGIASIMLTDTMVSSEVLSRSVSKTGADLSHTTATRAPWLSKGSWSSCAVYSGLCSTTVAPSLSTAQNATTCCGQFGMAKATRSPGRTPKARNPAAARHTSLSTSPQVWARPKNQVPGLAALMATLLS